MLRVNLTTDVYVDPLEHQRVNDLFTNQKDFTDVQVDWKRKDGTPIKARCTGWFVNACKTARHISKFLPKTY